MEAVIVGGEVVDSRGALPFDPEIRRTKGLNSYDVESSWS